MDDPYNGWVQLRIVYCTGTNGANAVYDWLWGIQRNIKYRITISYSPTYETLAAYLNGGNQKVFNNVVFNRSLIWNASIFGIGALPTDLSGGYMWPMFGKVGRIRVYNQVLTYAEAINYYVNSDVRNDSISPSWTTDGHGNVNVPSLSMNMSMQLRIISNEIFVNAMLDDYGNVTSYDYKVTAGANTGYTFSSWTLSNYATVRYVTMPKPGFGARANFTANQYSITLSQADATTQGTTSTTATFGSAMPSLASLPTRAGHVFGGYWSGSGGTGTQYYYSNGSSARTWDIASNTTLYPKWVAITFNAQTYNDTYHTWNYDYTYTKAISGGIGTFTYSFVSGQQGDFYFWDNTNMVCLAGSSHNAGTYTCTIRATHSTGTYKDAVITFKIAKASNSVTANPTINSTQTYSGSNKSVIATDGTAYGGSFQYSIDGGNSWTDKNNTVATNGGVYSVYYRVPESTNYNAIGSTYLGTFTITNTITFNKNGGSGGTDSLTVTNGAAMSNINIPAKTGYTFDGYYLNSVQYFNGSGVAQRNWNYGTNQTLTASWIAKEYTVNFDKQLGSGGSDSARATYDAAMPTITLPTRTGYTFSGYYSQPNGGGTQYYAANGTSARTWNIDAESTTLYANWSINSYTVSITAGAGVSEVYLSTNSGATSGDPSGTSYNYGTTVYGFAVLKPGYDSGAGWILVDSKNAKYYVGPLTVSTSGNDFGTQNATPKTYTVTLNTNGGTINSGNITEYTTGTGATLPTDVSHHNYGASSTRFAGWYTKNGILDNDWGTKVTVIGTEEYGNKTYYARFKEYGDSKADSYKKTDKLSSGEKIYIDVSQSSDWRSAGALNEFYFKNNTTGKEAWSGTLTHQVTTNVYECLVPYDSDGNATEWEFIIACRMNPAGPSSSWSGRWNQTVNINIGTNLDLSTGKNTVVIAGYGDYSTKQTSVTRSGLVTGDSIFLDTQSYTSEHYWYSANAKFVAYFFNDDGRDAYSSNFMTRVYGTSGYSVDNDDNYPLFEAIVPADSNGAETIWEHCIIIRVDPNCPAPSNAFDEEGGVFKYLWNRTPNLSWTSTTCYEKNVVKINYVEGSGYASLEYERTYEYRSDAFGNYLYRWFCETCEVTAGNTNLDDMKANWNTKGTRANGTNFEDQYNSMNIYAQGVFYLEQASSEGTTSQKAAFLYDYCVAKYGTDNLSNFVNRTPSASSLGRYYPGTSFLQSEDQIILIVIVVSSALLLLSLSTTAILIAKKKKTKH